MENGVKSIVIFYFNFYLAAYAITLVEKQTDETCSFSQDELYKFFEINNE